MVKIRKRDGDVLFTVKADSLGRFDFRGMDLADADFTQVDIRSADFRGAHLNEADLSGCVLKPLYFRGANLNRARLCNVTFTEGNLVNVNLRGAVLEGATFDRVWLENIDFDGASLREASFTGNVLVRVHFRASDFTKVDFTGARFWGVTFRNCGTLSSAIGLESIRHTDSTSLDAATLRVCVRTLPDAFLLSVGYTAPEIENLRAMYGQGIEFYSCFLSYARKDSVFADRALRGPNPGGSELLAGCSRP